MISRTQHQPICWARYGQLILMVCALSLPIAIIPLMFTYADSIVLNQENSFTVQKYSAKSTDLWQIATHPVKHAPTISLPNDGSAPIRLLFFAYCWSIYWFVILLFWSYALQVILCWAGIALSFPFVLLGGATENLGKVGQT